MKRISLQALAAMLLIVLFAASGWAAEQAKTRVTIDLSGHPFKGPANAPVTVVIFSDYL